MRPFRPRSLAALALAAGFCVAHAYTLPAVLDADPASTAAAAAPLVMFAGNGGYSSLVQGNP